MDMGLRSLAWTRHGPLLAFLAAGLAVIGFDLVDGSRFMVDVDDRMRALQIHDLLADGDWFDRTLPFIDMPEAYVSPWSRLVDLPYVLAVRALSPIGGIDAAMALAVGIWPLLLFILFAVLAVRVMRSIVGGAPRALHAAIAVLPMVFALWDFVPGRIDHHNVQLVLMLAMLAGLVDFRPGRGGTVAGIAATLSIEVGLECLPYIAVGFGSLALLAAMRGNEAVFRLRACGLAFALSAVPVALAFSGPAAVLAAACDAMSGFWVAAILLGGAVAAIVPVSWRLPVLASSAARLASLAIAGALAAGVLVCAFPACLDGPYAMVDAVSRSLWLDRLDQESGAAVLFENGAIGILGMLLVFLVVLGFALPPALRRFRTGAPAAMLVWSVAAVSLVQAFLMLRAIPFPSAFVSVLLPMVLRDASAATVRRRLLPAMLSPLLLAALAAPLFPASGRVDAVDLMIGDECAGEDFSVLGRVAPGRVLNPLALGIPIANERGDHTVAAVPFHRAAPGIRRSFVAFTAARLDERREALEAFAYVAVCRRETSGELSGAPLFEALRQGRRVAGIIEIDPGNSSRFRLYRLDASVPGAFALPGDAVR
ncbi:hypothetical protein [Oricola thermophila]|uniref:GtrA family protein n=1 Tax=Oricola thermophila TaxID=2742145 RepID=A0A6N1VIL3_9HYPH|nr:hypothetical protein [Oricola thermophila]QKV18827.1 hypothetical protein HTY61_10380 [Oricola thermophila]